MDPNKLAYKNKAGSAAVIFWLVLFLIPLLKMDFYVSIAAYLLFAALFRADVTGRKSVLAGPGFAEKNS